MAVATDDRIAIDLETPWRVRGRSQVVLTLNLGERAFSTADGSRERYWSVRGSTSFMEWLRGLAERVTTAGSPFELDEDSDRLTENAYSAGLLTQYIVDQEILPTYRIKQSVVPEFAFDEDTSRQFEGDASALREPLEKEGNRRLQAAWLAWPSKRIRLSRYGLVQVVLETAVSDRCTEATEFLSPISKLNASLGVAALRPAEPVDSLGNFLDRPEVKSRGQGVSVQWEIVGRLLTWLLDIIHPSRSPNDLLLLDPQYWRTWRTRRRFGSGHQDLPLRRRLVVFRIGGLECERQGTWSEVVDIDASVRTILAQLAEGTPLVELSPGQPQLSPQRRDALRQVTRSDRSSWRREACFLSHDTVVIVSLHEPHLVLKLDCDVSYGTYWDIVARTFEYLTELRIVARLLQLETSTHLQELMKIVGGGTLLKAQRDPSILFAAAAAGLVARLRNASSPNTISPADSLLTKLSALREAFGIAEALQHTDRNLTAIQRLMGHSENLEVQRSVLSLNIGIAAFTAAMMGMTLPMFVSERFGRLALRAWLPSWLAILWILLTLAMIGLALRYSVSKSFAKVRPRWKKIRGKVGSWLRRQPRPPQEDLPPTLSLEAAEPAHVSLELSDGSGAPKQATEVQLTAREDRLELLFECVDSEPWSTLSGPDAPLWTEEVVEVFLALGPEDPPAYVEFELNPGNALFDALIRNPTGRRAELAVDRSWSCDGIEHRVARTSQGWRGELVIPLRSVAVALGCRDTELPGTWRLNLYRIDRPRDGAPAEFTAWSPTFARQPDFHIPSRFGLLRLVRPSSPAAAPAEAAGAVAGIDLEVTQV